MNVPAVAATPEAKALFIDAVKRESIRDQRRAACIEYAQRSMDLYLGNHWATGTGSAETINVEGGRRPTTPATTNGLIRVIFNRVVNIVISMQAIQANDPPKIVFVARESGEKPLVYLDTSLPNPAVAAWAAKLGEAANSPLDPATESLIRAEIDTGKQLLSAARAAGAADPNVLPEEALVEVNDHTAAEALQIIFDGMWEECDGLAIFLENVLNKSLIGWQPTLYEFDSVEKKHVLRNCNQIHVFFDPLGTDDANNQLTVHDQVVSEDEAIAALDPKDPLYPKFVGAIRDKGKQGAPLFSGPSYTRSSVYDTQFERSMIVISTCWLKSWPYPMDPVKALKEGEVIQKDVPTGETELVYDTESALHLPQPKMAPAFFTRDGQPTDPKAENWPKRNGVRQMTSIAGNCVADRQSVFPWIQIVNNVNIPVPFSMYGQGEPKRLDGLQMAINYVLSALVTHQRYNAFPVEARPQSVTDRMPEAMRSNRTQPGKPVNVPDDLVQRFGDINKIIAYLKVPDMPADAWRLLEFLVKAIDQEGNNEGGVLQGGASASWSGEAINSLQSAGAAVIRAKSQKTELWLKRLARLMSFSIINLMGPADWARRCNKYPPAVMQAFHARAKSIDIDVSVEIASASGAAKQSQTNNLINAKAQGVPVSDPAILERLDLDPDSELQQQAKWLRRQAELAPQQPQPTQPAPPGQPPQAQASNNHQDSGQPAQQEAPQPIGA